MLHFIPLESINNIHSGDSLPPSVLSVGNNIRNNILEEDLEDIMSFLVDKTTDSLNISSPSQMRNCRFGDTWMLSRSTFLKPSLPFHDTTSSLMFLIDSKIVLE